MKRTHARDALITCGLILAACALCFVLNELSDEGGGAQLVFMLAVLLISRLTTGYLWGVLASVVSVVCANYMFTYPYFEFNLSISGYVLTFTTMLAVSLSVSVLTTQNKRQEKLRLESEKEKLRADLLRALSHDLRTPLTSIIGATGAILDNALSPDKQRELISDANSDAQWLIRMVDNLLAITRVGDDATPIHKQTEVVEDVLAEAVIKFKKHFPDVLTDMRVADEILLADMDAMLIQQVLINLLENAAVHGVVTRVIELRAERAGEYVVISVTDDGRGVDKELLPNVFTQTSGALRASADSARGMGIGLSVCMSIVKAHGGTMKAENLARGGARFMFTLPAKEDGYAV